MAKLAWDASGQHFYETGVDHAVLYTLNSAGTAYDMGYAWNGISSINESPSGADESPIYADNIKYLSLRAAEEFGCTIECYTYPDEFMECDGSASLMSGVAIGQQPRKTFGFSYVTTIGNDTLLDNYGYKIHLIYGASASPSDRQYQTINDSPEPIQFSWEFTTVPVPVTITGSTETYKPTSVLIVDSTQFPPELDGSKNAKLQALEDALYGSGDEGTSGGTTARLPLPGEVIELLT